MKKIIAVDDDLSFLKITERFLLKEDWELSLHQTPESFYAALQAEPFTAALIDLEIGSHSGLDVLNGMKERGLLLPAFICTAHGTISTAVQAVRNGALDYLLKPVIYEDLLFKLDRVLRQKEKEEELSRLQNELGLRVTLDRLSLQSPQLQATIQMCRTVLDVNTPILLLGETGTGKSMLARAMHYSGGRAEQPFTIIDCASIPATLLERELFGNEKGAYTDAREAREGKFEVAREGSVFLDEIGELPLELQTKFLRVLQEGEFERVGSTRTRKTRARVIAATNRDLKKMVAEGTFRQDLFYRLNVFPVTLPPLRERPVDIRSLTHIFVEAFKIKYAKPTLSIPESLLQKLLLQPFPGNVRELTHLLERSVILSPGTALELAEDSPPPGKKQTLSEVLAHEEKKYLLQTLDHCEWDTKAAAEIAGVTRKTIYLKLQEHAVPLPGKLRS